MGKFSRLGNALYEGDVSVDFVGRKWLWYAISGVILIASVSGLLFKGLNLGIEFEGGVKYTVAMPQTQATQTNADNLRDIVAASRIAAASSPAVNTAGKDSVVVQVKELTGAESATIQGIILRDLQRGLQAADVTSTSVSGGTQYTIKVPSGYALPSNVTAVKQLVATSGIPAASAPVVTRADTAITVQVKTLTAAQSTALEQRIVKDFKPGVQAEDISFSSVGAKWGEDVAHRAVTGLIVFLILVVLFIWGYFREWKMSVAAFIALIHDITITVGIYALSGFEVTPATVTGILTILGFSLYDTVVVFDKIRENTKDLRSSRRTYSELANLAVNQTLVRSINTSIVALLPVGALLYVGTTALGDGPLKDLALALFVGMAAGAYSSIFIATPLLVQMKLGEKDISESDRRAKARARRDADRYANVPTFKDDMPIVDHPDDVGDEGETRQRAPFQAPVSKPTAAGSGRVVPEAKAPVEQSGSAHRPQPTKQPRSKRGK